MDALAMIELNSVASGIEAGDEMLKTADVRLINALPVCPGKYMVMVQGGVAAVKSSIEAGKIIAKETLVDSLVIANVHPQVFSALNLSSEIKKRNALGIIETFSLVSTIYAADSAVKSADVDLIEIRLGRGLGGKAYVVLTGDVSAVKYAVESAAKRNECEGMIARTVVIPSPDPDLMNTLL